MSDITKARAEFIGTFWANTERHRKHCIPRLVCHCVKVRVREITGIADDGRYIVRDVSTHKKWTRVRPENIIRFHRQVRHEDDGSFVFVDELIKEIA